MQMVIKNNHQGKLSTWRKYILVALVIIILDQLSKRLVLHHFEHTQSYLVTDYFNLVRAHNTGAAFSFLAEANGWQRWFFIGIGLLATCSIVWLLTRYSQQVIFSWALSCILGGALGNVIDRILYGYVVDFLQFHWGFLNPLFNGGYFPAFNIADIAITIGASLLIVDELLKMNKRSSNK